MVTTDKPTFEQWTCDQEQALDKWEAIEWARKICDRTDVVYLDTETTGLNNAYPVEIAVISHHGSPLINTLVKPPVLCEPGVQRIHGITSEMLEDAPILPEIYPQLQKVLCDRHVVIYNATFDNRVLDNCCLYYDLPKLNYRFSCAMRWYADYCGVWNDYYGNYKWQKLPNAGHRASYDAFACRELVKKMAIAPYCEVEYNKMFPPVQLFCEWNEVAKLELSWKKPNDYHYSLNRRVIKLYLPKFKMIQTGTEAK